MICPATNEPCEGDGTHTCTDDGALCRSQMAALDDDQLACRLAAERERFEAWRRARGYTTDGVSDPRDIRWIMDMTERRWEAWLAAPGIDP